MYIDLSIFFFIKAINISTKIELKLNQLTLKPFLAYIYIYKYIQPILFYSTVLNTYKYI